MLQRTSFAQLSFIPVFLSYLEVFDAAHVYTAALSTKSLRSVTHCAYSLWPEIPVMSTELTLFKGCIIHDNHSFLPTFNSNMDRHGHNCRPSKRQLLRRRGPSAWPFLARPLGSTEFGEKKWDDNILQLLL